MGHRLSKITTRTGDGGSTGLADGSRLSKAALRVHALGEVDELNTLLGLLQSEGVTEAVVQLLRDIQHDLFDLGGELSLPGNAMLSVAHAKRIESAIERFNADLPPLKEFVLPGGSHAAAVCHLTRAVSRRVERTLVALNDAEPLNPHALIFINRLSDLLFVLARTLARADGGTEILWDRKRTARD